MIYSEFEYVITNITQGDSWGKVSILGGESIGPCEKKVHMNMCLMLNGYQDTAVWDYI
jgi:hypothetical protein